MTRLPSERTRPWARPGGWTPDGLEWRRGEAGQCIAWLSWRRSVPWWWPAADRQARTRRRRRRIRPQPTTSPESTVRQIGLGLGRQPHDGLPHGGRRHVDGLPCASTRPTKRLRINPVPGFGQGSLVRVHGRPLHDRSRPHDRRGRTLDLRDATVRLHSRTEGVCPAGRARLHQLLGPGGRLARGGPGARHGHRARGAISHGGRGVRTRNGGRTWALV